MSALPSLARFERDEAIPPPTLAHKITTSMFAAVAVGMVANLLLDRDFLDDFLLSDLLGVFFIVGYAVCLAVGAWRVRPRFDSPILFAIPYTVLWLQALAGLSTIGMQLVAQFQPPDPQLTQVVDYLGGAGVAAYALSPLIGLAFLILARRSGVLFFGEVVMVIVPFLIWDIF